MTTQDDPLGPNPKQAAAARARMERLSRLGAAGAIMMQQRAAERRSHAADLTARGDHLGAKFEVAEADELELDAEDILHPLSHTIAPVQIGRGGEMATGAAIATIVASPRGRFGFFPVCQLGNRTPPPPQAKPRP